MAAGLDAVAELLQQIPERAASRQAVIAANQELQERELIKLATLAAAAAAALRARGVAEPAASLTAQAGIGVFKVAFEQWVGEANRRPLADVIHASLRELRNVSAGHSP